MTSTIGMFVLQDQKSGQQSLNIIGLAAPTIPLAVAALTTVAPILPLGVTTLRDDSTESDQSLTYSQSQSEAIQRYM